MEAPQSRLQAAIESASHVLGHSAVVGRYHTLPSRFQDDYEVTDQVLGIGCSGAVHLTVHKQTGEKFAVKKYTLNTMMCKFSMGDIQMEAQIYLGLDHPHVARLVDVYESRTHLHMVMEACTGGELYDCLDKMENKKFTERDAAEAFHQMLLAVSYLHAHDIVHSDLKLDNFVYESEDSDHLKLIDFGASDICIDKTTLASIRGTPEYTAPEVFRRSYTTKCDIWSLGVILFTLLVGYLPFFGQGVQQLIIEGNYRWHEARWENVSAGAQALVRSLLNVDPNRRPSAQELLSDRWLTLTRQNAPGYVDRALPGRVSMTRRSAFESVVVALQQISNRSRFRCTCLSMMAWSLNQQERALVRDYFKVMDKNGDGSISFEEFRQTLRQWGSSLDDVAIQQAFQAIDTSGNHEINYTEFLAAMFDVCLGCHDNLVWSAFNRFDRDNSCQITVANLKNVLCAGFSDREIQTIVSHVDTAGDGVISYDEFYAYLNKSMYGSKRLSHDLRHPRINRLITEANATARPVSPRVHRDDDICDDADESSEEEEEDGFLSRLLGRATNKYEDSTQPHIS